MSRYRGPRLRVTRRLGELPGLTRKASKKSNPPGQHGQDRDQYESRSRCRWAGPNVGRCHPGQAIDGMIGGGGGGGDGKIGIRRPSLILIAAGGDSPAVLCYNSPVAARRHSTIINPTK